MSDETLFRIRYPKAYKEQQELMAMLNTFREDFDL